MSEHEHPMPGQQLGVVREWNRDSQHEFAQRVEYSFELDDSNVILSRVVPTLANLEGPVSQHKTLVDIDMPVKLIESSTPGHFHLYIDKAIAWEDYRLLLIVLERCGIISTGYLDAALTRGYTTLRLPWVKKGDPAPPRKSLTERLSDYLGF